ncbi:MAG TPA: hypothetical protein VFE84_03850 [Patescibacteria group bacterium]|jgi:hypothetical protein|nr:hypothetical protein [Patescibacteria group bacterium]
MSILVAEEKLIGAELGAEEAPAAIVPAGLAHQLETDGTLDQDKLFSS